MTTRFLPIIASILFSFNSIAQVKNPEPITKAVNSALMHQVLNDFDRTIPLVFFVPGFFYIGSAAYQNNPLFSESDYFDNEELVRTSNYYQKEIFDVLNSGFIAYVPVDSIMQVRVIQGNSLLFEQKFIRKADTTIFIQTDVERRKSKSVSYTEGKVLTISYNDFVNEMSYYSQLIGDTLRINELVDKRAGKRNKTVMRYSGGLISEASYFDFYNTSGETNLKYTDHYFYNELNLPGKSHTVNRKGKITDSTLYFYDEGKLTHYKSFKGSGEKLSITYLYNKVGQISGKAVKSLNRNYYVDYSYANGNIADIEIDDKAKAFKRHYIFKTDVSKRLVGIEYNTITKESLIETLKTQWIFGYNEKGNISFVKVVDVKGLINKEIKFEYDFFGSEN